MEPEKLMVQRLRAVEISRPGIDLEEALTRHAVRRRAQARPLRWMAVATAATWLLVLVGGELTSRSLRQFNDRGVTVARQELAPEALRAMFERRVEALLAAEGGSAPGQPPAQTPDKASSAPPERRGYRESMPMCKGGVLHV